VSAAELVVSTRDDSIMQRFRYVELLRRNLDRRLLAAAST
jgi:hypothetical protein